MTSVGFVGLGNMGGNMAARLLAAGHPVSGWQRSRDHAEHLIEQGLEWRETPRAVAEGAEVVVTALPDDAVLDVAGEEGRVLVTLNIGDFARLHQQWLSEGRQHCGLVMVTTQAFPQNRRFVGALVGALHEAATKSSLPTPGDVLYLRPLTGT